MEDLIIAKLGTANTALAEAKTIQETKKVLDIATAAEIYAKRQQLGDEAILYATSIKIEALAQLGRMLRETPRAKGGQPYQYNSTGTNLVLVEPTLADMGLDKRTSKLAQDIASLPEIQKERLKNGEESIGKAMRVERRKNRIETTPVMPDGKYNLIYADPPWQYGFGFDIHGAADRHYSTMTLSELCALPVLDFCEDNCILFIWTTSPKLFDAKLVIDAWGFEYKTSFVWDKVSHVMGHYNSVRHEFLLICGRGSFPKQSDTLHDSVITIERSDTHSEKPDYFRKLIENMYPKSKKIEMFGRKKIDGWTVWGNEA
jgi:N6-adenosine-specific RNA methylase IME4